MKKFITLVTVALASFLLVGCGQPVEVPPAHVGKVLTKNGYAPETIPPSKFRLEFCVVHCDKLVTLEASDVPFRESMSVFMPSDDLKLGVDVRGTMSVMASSGTVDMLYDRLVAKTNPEEDSVMHITSGQVYGTYARQALRGVVRSQLVKRDIATILKQRESVAEDIHAAIVKKLESTGTPIKISRFELADVNPPKVIIDAQEAAKRREIDIQRAEADAQVEMVKAERALEVAKKDRLVQREKAAAIAEQNRIAAESITPQLLAYRRLETAERIYSALSQSDNVIIVPADSGSFAELNDDAVLAKLLGNEFKGAGVK